MSKTNECRGAGNVEKKHGIYSHKTWVPSQVQPRTICVTFGKLFNLSEQSSHNL